MTAELVLERAARLGIELLPGPQGKLLWRAAQAPASDLRQAMLEHKAAILQLLAQRHCPSCTRPLDAKARCWRCHYRRCSGCGRDTGSAFIELCTVCGLKFHASERGLR